VPAVPARGRGIAAQGISDDDPRPPAGGALHPDYPEFAASAARMLDDELCAAIGVTDAEPLRFRFDEGHIEDLYEVVKLMVDELEGHRQWVHERAAAKRKLPSR
jgi:hypothetical protein